jgi:hypothetical protein
MMKIFLFLIFLGTVRSTQHFRTKEDLPLDENGRLESHWLLHTENPSCRELVRKVWVATGDNSLREIAGIDDKLARDIFGEDFDINGCSMACLERGSSFEMMTHIFPEQKLIQAANVDMVQGFLRQCQKVELGFISYHQNPLMIYWIDIRTGERVEVGTVNQMERNTAWQGTTLGHTFHLVDTLTDELVGQYTAEYNALVVINGPGISGLQNMDVVDEIKETLAMEFGRSKSVRRTFTELGFAKGRLPNDLWNSIQTYYYNNRNNRAIEEWGTGKKGLYVNWWEKDVYFIGIPWELKVRYSIRMTQL